MFQPIYAGAVTLGYEFGGDGIEEQDIRDVVSKEVFNLLVYEFLLFGQEVVVGGGTCVVSVVI